MSPPRTCEKPQVAAGRGPDKQQDPPASKFKPVVFASITQHATEENDMQIIICQLEIALPPPPPPQHNADALTAKTSTDVNTRRLAPCVWQPCFFFLFFFLSSCVGLWLSPTAPVSGADIWAQARLTRLHLRPTQGHTRPPPPGWAPPDLVLQQQSDILEVWGLVIGLLELSGSFAGPPLRNRSWTRYIGGGDYDYIGSIYCFMWLSMILWSRRPRLITFSMNTK